MVKDYSAAWDDVKAAFRQSAAGFQSKDYAASFEEPPHQPRKVFVSVKRDTNRYPPEVDRTASIDFDGLRDITVQKSAAQGLNQYEFGMKDGTVFLTDKSTSKTLSLEEFCHTALTGILFPEVD